jgi:hypothetical protein
MRKFLGEVYTFLFIVIVVGGIAGLITLAIISDQGLSRPTPKFRVGQMVETKVANQTAQITKIFAPAGERYCYYGVRVFSPGNVPTQGTLIVEQYGPFPVVELYEYELVARDE